MVESDKQNRFEDAFERGRLGNIGNYEAWLQDQGFHPDRLTDESVAEYFRDHPEDAPGHDAELEEIAEFLGFFSRRDGPFHIALIGVTGSGKTQLLATVDHMLDQLGIDLPSKRYAAGRFTEETENERTRWDEALAELADLKKAVILLDDCGDDKRIAYSLETLHDTVPDAFIITTWTPERWNLWKDEVSDTLTVSQKVELTPLDERTTTTALQATVAAVSADSVDVPEDLYQRIAAYSLGIPGMFQRLLRHTVKETFLNDLELGDTAAADAAAQTLHLDHAEDRVYELSDKKLHVLKHILLARHPQGRRPTELGERLDRDKSTVSYHLQGLTGKRLVEKENAGRSTFYRVAPPVKPLVQRRIAQEGEFHAEL